ncbi:MAG: hypothetical protein JF603_07450 [Acidobacteria bacterium]|nr:hypothetical protein [Acidobacteriota bacterium]
MKLQDTTYARGAESLVDATRQLAEEGWGGQATPMEGGSIRCDSCGVASPAGRFGVDGFHRQEGASDPDDQSAVVAITCPACSAKAALVLHYGPAASPEDADVLAALPDPPQRADTP